MWPEPSRRGLLRELALGKLIWRTVIHEMMVLSKIIFFQNLTFHLFGEYLKIILKAVKELCDKLSWLDMEKLNIPLIKRDNLWKVRNLYFSEKQMTLISRQAIFETPISRYRMSSFMLIDELKFHFLLSFRQFLHLSYLIISNLIWTERQFWFQIPYHQEWILILILTPIPCPLPLPPPLH
jgi:hypothetical protein